MKLTRRTVLAAAAATGALAACGERFELVGPFPLSVASGDATPTSAILWTRYQGSNPLTVRVWREDAMATPVLESPVTAAEGGFVHFDATGLTPFTWHGFDFSDGVERSARGRFRTAPAVGQFVPLTFGAVSCIKEGFSFATLKHAAQRTDLDAFLFLGDTVYADGAKNLDGFRDKWTQGLANPAHSGLRASVSAIDAWDDHELFNNWNADDLPNEPLFSGKQAFFEFQPVRTGADRRLYRSLLWGSTAEVFVLDCRGERRPSTDHYISTEQMDWLKDGLARSPARFKLILNSVPISNFPGAFFDTTTDDRWQGYPKQRDEILGFVEDANVRGVLWVAGDFHLACMGRVSLKGRGTKAIEVLVGPGAQTPNVSPSYPDVPQFDWASGINNYTTFTLDPVTVEVEVKYFDGNGKMLTQRTYSL